MSKEIAKNVVEDGSSPEDDSTELIRVIISDPNFMQKPIGKMDLQELRAARSVLQKVFGWDIKPFVD